jgi:hypothetical protein
VPGESQLGRASPEVLIAGDVPSRDRSKASATSAQYHLVACALGCLLLIAALGKLQSLTSVESAATGQSGATVALIAFELSLGGWLLLFRGVRPARLWHATLVTFGCFLCVSAYRAFRGETSCGCLGDLRINPWYALSVDAASLAALLLTKPADELLGGSGGQIVAILLSLYGAVAGGAAPTSPNIGYAFPALSASRSFCSRVSFNVQANGGYHA